MLPSADVKAKALCCAPLQVGQRDFAVPSTSDNTLLAPGMKHMLCHGLLHLIRSVGLRLPRC